MPTSPTLEMATNRHIYTRDELDTYFTRVALPVSKRIYNVSTLSPDEQLTFLNLLQKHHLCKIPWENLIQHYSWHHAVSTHPPHLFREIVLKPGRGGYCMQVNYFQHLILHSLGFDAYMAGSRIWHAHTKNYGGWTHVVNIVTIAGERYMLDGGFGPQGPVTPIKLDDGVIRPQIAPAEMRVVRESIPNNLSSQRIWIYQYRYAQDKPWTPAYCFTDLEFTPEDIEGMNFEPWMNRRTFFTFMVLCNRFTTSGEKHESDRAEVPGSPGEAELEGEIDGAIGIEGDVLKWRRRGKKVVEVKFKTDGERVKALRKYFGIELGEDEVEGIRDTVAAVREDEH